MEQKLELPQYIDSTMLSTFRSCPHKFYNSFIRNIVPSGQSVHLVAGGALAAGVEAARNFALKTRNLDTNYPAPIYSIDDLMLAAFPAFSKAWGDYEAPEDSAKSFHNTLYAMERYLTEFHPQKDPVQPKYKADGTPSTEFSFAIPIDILHPNGEPFIFVGRFDMLGEFNGLPVIVDEKTTGSLGQMWTKQWDMRGQFIGYCWACQQLGIQVDNAVIRGIGILKTDIKFLTAYINYPKHLIDRWVVEMYNTIFQMVHFYNHSHFPQVFSDACGSFGGCAYTTLCLAKNPENWLNNYETRTWSPVSQLESD